MSTLTRPVVKRQYGRKPSSSSSSAGPPPSSASCSSSSPLRPSLLSNTIINPAWDAAVKESMREGDVDKGNRSTPPTSPSSSTRTAALKGKGVPRPQTTTTLRKATGGGDLRSFFTTTSLTKPRVEIDNDDDDDDDNVRITKRRRTYSPCTSAREEEEEEKRSNRRSSTRSSFTTFSSSNKSKPRATPKLTQLYLDPFDTPGRSTLSCSTCGLSYSRTPQDLNFHSKHHKKIVSGIDWFTTSEGTGGVTVLEEGIEWDGREEGKILMIDWSIAETSIKRKLNDVMETIDTELSSTSLTREQLSESKLFVFVTPNRKVVACAVVQRIQEAFQVVVTDAATTTTREGGNEGLIRFGDTQPLEDGQDGEDSGAIFCSPEPLSTVLGVHRIWTTTSSRRHGLASRLLTRMAERFLYACPISQERRKLDVAFSQPTGKGKELAQRWTGTKAFKVFVD